MIGVPNVILIEQRDQIAAGIRGAMVTSGRLTAIFFAQQSDRMRVGEPLNNRCTVIGRSVVDNDDIDR